MPVQQRGPCRTSGYGAVLRMLTEQLQHLPGWGMQKLPTSAALTRARQRLGSKALQLLFEGQCGHLAGTPTGAPSPSVCG
ncbi:transposase domain-containing protein [Streptomyces cavernae]|uniref:transposase domain-containing protein n=1 Tax=Streptomyces cavernae TaxID=2259034 RepID=UPI003B75D1C4